MAGCTGTLGCHWTWGNSFCTKCHLTPWLPTFKHAMNRVSRISPLLTEDLKGTYPHNPWISLSSDNSTKTFQNVLKEDCPHHSHTFKCSSKLDSSTSELSLVLTATHPELQLLQRSRWMQHLWISIITWIRKMLQCIVHNINKIYTLYASL